MAERYRKQLRDLHAAAGKARAEDTELWHVLAAAADRFDELKRRIERIERLLGLEPPKE